MFYIKFKLTILFKAMNIKQGSTSTNNKIDRSNHASSKTSLSPPSVQTFGDRDVPVADTPISGHWG